ncbi:glucoamylase family protein [Anditalea andensis]|uniref:Periplasmic beta-glucosidase n=1 Tax=Anditalea andensis TaxID=1048983 RepID=A0A074KXI9_9BACT|nr:glucoamylase family protein [Anditalea andensis]KEO74686.1 hypothetical protein EL17_03145 [Anditalea andensis]
MRKALLPALIFISFLSCNQIEDDGPDLVLLSAAVGQIVLSSEGPSTDHVPMDRPINLNFSEALDPATVENALTLYRNEEKISISINLISGNRTILVYPNGALSQNSSYKLIISSSLKNAKGGSFAGQEISFSTLPGNLEILSLTITHADETLAGRIVNVPLDFTMIIDFSDPIDTESFRTASSMTGTEVPALHFTFENEHKRAIITGSGPLQYLRKYQFNLANTLKGADGGSFTGLNRAFFTRLDDSPKFPVIAEEELLTKVQQQTFRYFWDFAHEHSGMARERNTSGSLVTVGGSGFGVMAIIVGIERGFITRQQGVERWARIVDFLGTADRFHGVWPHWLDGSNGSTVPFSTLDDGGDLVETAFMIQGLLTVKAYLDAAVPSEKYIIDKINTLWHEVEWDWYTRGGQDVLYWHWSPAHEWQMNLPIRGYNESLIVYVLAASSPTYPIDKSVYEKGWARDGAIKNGQSYYQHLLPLGESYGGPLFFAHYSYLGLDPRNLKDQYANYWEQNRNHTLIHQAHAISNPSGYVGYSEESWGFTASDNHEGYAAHAPNYDKGVITPTAALSSFPYTPEESMKALKFFYFKLGDRLWGEYGFYDAFNPTEEWYASSYLAIDQGPIILMIENHRTALLWRLFMQDIEVKEGLEKLQFNY